ncbi:MAG: hypothetical protein WAQ57_01950 [Candidatus Saccharimonadales bacterium]
MNILGVGLASLLSGVQLFAAMPATTNYKLQDYGFGNGGGTTGTTNYQLEGIAGEQSGQDAGTANYGLGSGLQETQQAAVPSVTLVNPNQSYSMLHVTITPSDNPSDALFMIAISDDSFTTTQYVQDDGTIGAVLGMEDYQTYAAWGGAGGSNIIGLSANTTYQVKARAMTGEFTETGYGPASSAATVDVTLTFDIDVSASDTETAAPYAVAIGDLLPGTVTDAPSKIWLDLETNAASGARVFVLSANAGLASLRTGYTISSASGNLSSLGEGFGVRGDTATQGGGGPLSLQSPYDGTLDNIGVIDASYRTLLATTSALTAGRSSVLVKAKATSNTPASTDYADIYTLVAAASF